LEALNPELAVTGSLPTDRRMKTLIAAGGGCSDVRAPEYEGRESRGVYVAVVGGLYNYSYVARATTPGAFVVPPVKAEEMYSPENYGREGRMLS